MGGLRKNYREYSKIPLRQHLPAASPACVRRPQGVAIQEYHRLLQSVSTFFGAKKVEKETSTFVLRNYGGQVGRRWKSRLRIWREGSGKRELAPRSGSSLRQRVFFRSLRWMRDGAFPMRPSLFHRISDNTIPAQLCECLH
jgi:hypothetical protein